KLDAMENPYRWPEDVVDHWLETLRSCELNRYPDPEAKRLTSTLRRLNRLSENIDLLLGNGSDEIIQMLLMALPAGSSVVSPDPSFVMYRQIAHSLGLDYHGIGLDDAFQLDMPSMRRALRDCRPALIFLAFPNNPTGNLFRREDILELLEIAPGLVILDEAYAPFADDTFMNSLEEHANLLVMRTVSKLGLAGLRLGYIAGDKQIIGHLNKIRLPYNINILTQASAEFALNRKNLFDEQIEKIRSERSRLLETMNELEGVAPFPSAANFILFQCMTRPAQEIFDFLLKRGILIKNLSSQKGLPANCLRVTVGKPEENQAFLDALRQILTA
ncbi:MAG: histidinol-phosphate transaminase, partial [Gammaproteobacteria bacterium]